MSAALRAMVVFSALTIGPWPPAARSAAQDAPRLAIRAGDGLVYEADVTVTSPEQSGAAQWSRQVRITCLRADDRERLIVLERRSPAPRPVTETGGILLVVDDRGQVRFSPESQGQAFDFALECALFPPLPSTLDRGAEWLSAPDAFDRRWRCVQPRPDPAFHDHLRVEFTVQDDDGTLARQGLAFRGAYWINPAAGLVTRCEIEQTDRTAHETMRIDYRLAENQRQTPIWCAARLKELDGYRARVETEQGMQDELFMRPTEIEPVLARLGRVWSEFAMSLAGEADSPILRLAQANARRVAANEPRHRELAQMIAPWANQEAAQWSLTDFDGGLVRSEDVRDRWVLEVFWSAASADSIRMLRLAQAAYATQSDPRIRAVCICLDRDAEAAAAVARQYAPELLHVLSGPPVHGQTPPVLPILRLLDTHSRVRLVRVGWQPRIVHKVLELLPETLAGGPTGP